MQYSDFEPMLIVLGTVGIFFIVLYTFQIRRTLASRKKLPELRQQLVELLRDALVDFPEPELSLSPITPLTILAFVVATMAFLAVPCLILYSLSFFYVQGHWPVQLAYVTFRPTLSLLVLAICIWIVLPVTQRIIVFARPGQALSKRMVFVLTAAVTAFNLGASAIIFVPLVLDYLTKPSLPFPYTFLAYVVVFVLALLTWYRVIPSYQFFVSEKLARAEYESALKRAKLDNTILSQSANTLYNLGTVLVFSGRANEAEPVLRQCANEMLKSGQIMPGALVNFAYALLRQDRFENARKLFEGIIQLFPTQGHAYAGLAEVYLFQGRDAAAALNTTQRFFEDKSRQVGRQNKGHLLATLLADAAWAQAILGRRSDAEGTLNLALKKASRRFRPGYGGVYYRAGEVMRLIGDRDRAFAYFERAYASDPQGAYGAFSTQALEEMKNDAGA